MKTSPAGIALIKRFEGLELEAYQDIAGVWTIGNGHSSKGFRDIMEDLQSGAASDDIARTFLSIIADIQVDDGIVTITETEAESLLKRDLTSRENLLNGWLIQTGVTLNQNQFDALISFIYNVGFAAFKRSTAAKRIIKGDFTGAADALTWWNKARVGGRLREVLGLTRRRAAERALFLTPAHDNAPVIDAANDNDHRESNACPACESRPLVTRFPRFVWEIWG